MMLGIEVFRQPSPSRNPGGDCFACSLFAVLRYLYPDKHPTFEQVWESFQYEQERYSEPGIKDKFLRNVWDGMRRAAYDSLRHISGESIQIYTDMVHPRFDSDRWSHSWGSTQFPEGEWSRRVEAWLAAGWVILIEMAHGGVGPFDKDGHRNWTDHFAIIDGQRTFWERKEYTYKDPKTGEEKKSWSGGEQHETHVVCSAKGPYWIRTKDLMHYHGVNAFYIIRKDTRVYRDYSWNESPENQALIKD